MSETVNTIIGRKWKILNLNLNTEQMKAMQNSITSNYKMGNIETFWYSKMNLKYKNVVITLNK